ncbi:glutamine amidotransferase, partial [Roseovarius sp.]|uniref:glutamine amidotransferase n=1 Tax=Roseovarius sp. TaxID=1486281 RepID=UPI00356B56E8
MCGIVGLFLKDKALEPRLGELLTDMLITMSDRGPDSAGIAVYPGAHPGFAKLTVQADDPARFEGLEASMSDALGADVTLRVKDTHAVIELPADKVAEARDALKTLCPEARVMSAGEAIEIYKEVGLPGDVARRFDIPHLTGSHGIGHTRMATESAVTTLGAHPFSTGMDQCLVHNGSLSNHNSLRRKLAREGVTVETENDTEVAAASLTWKMQEGH